MLAEQLQWSAAEGWPHSTDTSLQSSQLVLYFGTRDAIADGERYRELKVMFPAAHVLGCSTGGQIWGDDVSDEVGALAIRFDATRIGVASALVAGTEGSRTCGETIARCLAAPDLAGLFILSDGLNVNGNALVAGITSVLGNGIPITGGLAGDGSNFERTLVGCDGEPRSNIVAGVGFYGEALRIGHGSSGGWDVFGPRRRISGSLGNIVYELDSEPALDLYERYLGEDAEGLPGSALLFPLRIYDPKQPHHDVVRTVLSVDREKRSLTFAGDMPEGWTAQLMRGNLDRLAAGAAEAARQARQGIIEASGSADANGVALLVSCIGRRLLMGQRATDEIEAAKSELGTRTLSLGFYSYGEISPHAASGMCELHNQTMTVTTICECMSEA